MKRQLSFSDAFMKRPRLDEIQLSLLDLPYELFIQTLHFVLEPTLYFLKDSSLSFFVRHDQEPWKFLLILELVTDFVFPVTNFR